MGQSPSLIGPQIVKEFLTVYYCLHNSLPPGPLLHHINPVCAPTIPLLEDPLYLSSHLCLGLPSGLFSSGFPAKTLHAHPLSSINSTCPAHLILFNHPYNIWWGTQITRNSLCSLLHPPPPLTLSLLGPNIFLSTPFSNILSLCSSLNMTDQVSHPYKTKGIL